MWSWIPNSRKPLVKHPIALAAVTLTIALSACGSPDDDPAPSPPVDGSGPTLVADATGEMLSVTFAGENPAPRAWPIVTGRVPEDLPLCQTL